VGTTAEGAQDEIEFDPETGEAILDETTGQPAVQNPEDRLGAALEQYRNGAWIVIPAGAKVDPLQVQGEGAPFIQAFDHLNREMVLAILLQTLATLEAQFGTRAQSQTHQDILGLLAALLRTWVEEFIERDILAPLVEYNYGPDCLHLVPKVTFGDTGEEDLAGLLTALAGLGYKLDPATFREVDVRTGLPVRSQESVEQAQEMQQAALEGLKKNAAPGEQDPQENPEGPGPGKKVGQPDEKQPAGAAA